MSKIPKKYLINLFKDLNSFIQEHLDEEFKIGHSYFMLEDLTIEKLNMVWNYEIKPLIKEYFFNDKKKVDKCQDLFDNTIKQLNDDTGFKSADSNTQMSINHEITSSDTSTPQVTPQTDNSI